MPTWIHPNLRSLQEAEEQVGLIKSINSAAVTIKLAQEAAGTVVKPVPVVTRVIVGTSVKAK